MDDLNKNQIILLTLLVSFVTSIASGIITTSLLQQAPVEVTKTMNQIVERTIEKVVPQDIISTVTSVPQTREIQTVVVKEDDMITSSISKNIPSVVRLVRIDSEGFESQEGMGLIISKDGTVFADRSAVAMNSSYRVRLSDGTNVAMTLVPTSEDLDFILLRPTDPAISKKVTFTPVTFDSRDIQLGQTIVGFGGWSSDAVSVGRVVSLPTRESGDATNTVKYIYSIETNLDSKDLLSGSPLFNLNGLVVGVTRQGSKIFVPASLVKKQIALLTPAD
jgi:S1-C subfamily serine protease